MTCDRLPRLTVGGVEVDPAHTLWSRAPARPDHWRLSRRGTRPQCEAAFLAGVKKSPACEYLILPPGETPLLREAAP